ncbi:MAG TPA: HAMP domain-containing sensor histidine kinase [Woeseiaceae bacterium]|nr:HAMP domain-containing sensor histidine kinase [Woeseiaceae bacterium]
MATPSHNAEQLHEVLEIFSHPTRLLDTGSRQKSERRECNERLSAIGKMTAEFAHQVRTPLASAMLYAGQIDTSNPRQAQIAIKLLHRLNDLKRMVNDMLVFAADARADREQVNIRTLFDEVCESIDGQLGGNTTLCTSVTDETLSVAANKDALKGALLNLVTNADQACRQGANILLHGHRFGDDIHLCVTDDGPGIPLDVQPRLFDAFFTTRPQGTGLGLSVVKAVVAAHGGEVLVSTSDRGSSFTIRIPGSRRQGVAQ